MESFDIFDTVLVRKCGNAANLFYLLACKVYINDESQREAFYHWRCQAETIAKKKFNREPSLKDIYSVFDKESFKDVDPDKILLTELELEKENLIPNWKVCSKLKESKDYIFISDMYLPSSFLIEILCSYELLKNNNNKNAIFVSCEYNSTKATGTLYDAVKQKLGIKTWTHYGDNAWSDIKQAKKKGIKAIKINSNFSKSEQFYLNQISLLPNKREFEILISIQRAIRLNLEPNNRTAFAIDCIAPLYIGYVCHILETAKKRGITTLYFLSRDSYILYKIAQQYRTEYPTISLRYLFVSRKSLIHPCIYKGTADEICEIMGLESFKGENVKRIANYLQLEENAFNDLGFKYIKTDENVIQFKEYLNNYSHRIINKSAQSRYIILQYFKQEGLLKPGKKAVVDVGWLGTSRFLINKLLTKEGYNPVESFYLMNFFRVLPPSKGIYNSYLGQCDFKSPIVPIIEVLYSASPYRSALSYEAHKNKIFPVFNQATNPAKSGIIKCNLLGVLKMVNNIKQQNIDFSHFFSLWSRLSILCTTNPSNIDVSVLTDLEDQDELGRDKALVRKLSFPNLIFYPFKKNKSSLSQYSVYYTNPLLAPYIIGLHKINTQITRKIKQVIKGIIKF